MFEVIKGNPTAEELQGLALVFEQLKAVSKANATPADRNGWGQAAPVNHRAALFNPHAFGASSYF